MSTCSKLLHEDFHCLNPLVHFAGNVLAAGIGDAIYTADSLALVASLHDSGPNTFSGI